MTSAEDLPTRLKLLSDEDLMALYQSGNDLAFATLYERYRRKLFSFVSRMIGGSEVEEIFQDVWLGVIKGRERYTPAAPFATYLFTIAHNRVAENLRRRGRHMHVDLPEGAEGSPIDEPSPQSLAISAELGRALGEAIGLLPVPQREAFLMHTEGGLTLEEIAKATGTPRETVKSRLRYATKHLRKALENWK